MLRNYRKIDAGGGFLFDLDEVWFRENVTSQPCFYCGTADVPRGADRINNSLGHTKQNVIPCCQVCNKVRNNHFSVEEMKLLGAAIAQIRKARKHQ